MKILLINPPDQNTIIADNPSFIDEERGANPPLGLLYIAASLRQQGGHTVEVLDAPVENIGYDTLVEAVRERSPDLVGITAMTFTLIDVMKTVQVVKSVSTGIKVVLGGVHATLYPRETISLAGIDFVIMGEGEKTFVQLVNHIDDDNYLGTLPGVCFRRDGKVIENKQGEFIHDLDSLPFPARDLVPYKKYTSILSERSPITTMFTSRGCPFGCTFCYRPHMGSRFRARSAANVVDEMELCVSMGIREILFYDDTFTIDRNRVLAICDEIMKRGLDCVWDIRTRIDTVDEEMIKRLKKAHCARIHYGVEAGTDKILRFLRKGITLKQVEDTFRMTRKYGIDTLAYFMIGSPSETKEDILATIAFAKKIHPDYAHITITTPFPGTDLYRLALEEKVIEKDYWRDFAQDPGAGVQSRYWEKELSRKELLALLTSAYKDFYLRPQYIFSSMAKIRSFRDATKRIRAGFKMLAG